MPLGKKCGSSVSEGLTWTLYRRGFVRDVTNRLIKFYTMTRLHFIVKAENKAREGKRRQRMHYLKLRRET
ncbi:hypothetical protein MRX96_032405 [Rhipicephalus microplus]